MTSHTKVREAFDKIKAKDYAGAESLLKEGLEATDNKEDQALFHSTLGVLFKLKEDPKEAWRHYEQAEKLLPDDPALKIISAKFLIDRFAQHDTALKKLKKVLKLAKGSPSFEHQAHALAAIAFLKKGDRKKAVKMFHASMADDFQSIVTSENINLDVIAAFTARNFEPDLCREYLEKGRELAEARNEKRGVEMFQKLLVPFISPPTTKTSAPPSR